MRKNIQKSTTFYFGESCFWKIRKGQKHNQLPWMISLRSASSKQQTCWFARASLGTTTNLRAIISPHIWTSGQRKIMISSFPPSIYHVSMLLWPNPNQYFADNIVSNHNSSLPVCVVTEKNSGRHRWSPYQNIKSRDFGSLITNQKDIVIKIVTKCRCWMWEPEKSGTFFFFPFLLTIYMADIWRGRDWGGDEHLKSIYKYYQNYWGVTEEHFPTTQVFS